ncbi:hypothetical protein ACFFWD_20950 [Bradyrhizobium erythrophlei]|uniref:hypothetical protein n=1 Tax=Bradyrhizobium erythrophlei TaxID=1437360 RepID=UPI0035E9206A
MRHMITGLVAAVAVMADAPAMACGFNTCGYSAPVVNYGYSYSGCNTGCGWGVERLPDPLQYYPAQQYSQQYYYVNQGPTYTGPGNWAPRPYYEGTQPYYGYGYGYRRYHHYYHRSHIGYRYGYAPRHAYGPRYAPAYHYGHRVLRRYY